MSIQQCPNEILENIIRLTETMSWERNIPNCAMVCRSWNTPACRILYEKIEILGSSRKLLLSLAQQKENRGIFCKALSFGACFGLDDQERPFTSPAFAQLLSYLPHVKQIELQHYPYRAHYLNLLREHADMLLNVQEISHLDGPWTSKEQQLYYSCAIAFKDTLKCIELLNFETITHDGGSGNIVSILPKFKSLNDLRIKNLDERFASNLPQLRMFQLMRLCIDLKRFSILSDFKEPLDDGVSSFNHKKLEYLDINVPEITKKHVEYIISNISRLKHFKLKSGHRKSGFNPITPVQWIEELGPVIVDRFQSFLSEISNVELSFGENFLSKITTFWPLISGAINDGNRPLPVHIFITVDNAKMYPKCMHVRLMKCKSKVSLQYELDLTSILSDAKETKPTTNLILPFDYQNINLQSMLLYIRFDENDRLQIIPALELLESVLNTIPSIHHIHVKVGTFLKTPLVIKIGSKELMYEKSPRYVEIRDEGPFLLEDKLKHVLLQRTDGKTITAALERLPNTKYLKLFAYKLRKDKNYNVHLDLGLLHLQYLMLHLNPIIDRSNNKQVIILQIEQEKPNQTIYYKWQRECKEFQVVNFELIGADFFKTGNHFKRRLTTILHINCSKIEEIKFCLDHTDYVDTTLNLSIHQNKE